jgi:phospholipid/cholesterol/gamma-HCH transport system substrate-binding protein
VNDDRLNTRVGAFVLIALIAGVTAVLAFEGQHVSGGLRVHVKMERAGALKEGQMVKVSGRTIGSVEAIRLNPCDADMRPEGAAEDTRCVVVDLWIEKSAAWLLRQDSVFFINQQYLLGEPYLEVAPAGLPGQPLPEPGPPLADGATVRGVDPPRLDRLMQKSYENLVAVTDFFKNDLPETRDLFAQIDELQETLAQTDPAPGAAAESWTSQVALYRELVATGVWWEQAGVDGDRLSATGGSLRATIARARAELAKLGVKLDALSAALAPLGDRLDAGRFARAAAAIDKGRAIADKLDRILATADELVAMVQAGQGTLGAFLQDREVADEIKATARIMKQQPWRTAGNRRNRDAVGPIVP